MGSYTQPRKQRTGFASGRYAIAICDGCGFKYAYLDLSPHPITNLRYCDDCGVDSADRLLPTVLTDRIALRYPRPDAILDVPGGVSPPPPPGGSGEGASFEDGTPFTFDDGDPWTFEDS